MFDELLPELKKIISKSAGAIPVVFQGIDRQFEKGSPNPTTNRHAFHELLYITAGRAVFDIGKHSIPVQKGDTLVIRPGVDHTIRVESGTVEMVVLYFGFNKESSMNETDDTDAAHDVESNDQSITIEKFLQLSDGTTGHGTADETSHRANPYLNIKGKVRHDISAIVGRIANEYRNNESGKELMIQFLAMELLIVLSRGLREELDESALVRTGKSLDLVRIAQDFIVRNHDQNLSVTDMASHVYLSKGYFARVFREVTGMSPIHFLVKVRVDHARRLLEDENLKIAGISRATGFSCPQRFSAAFRKQMGITPLEYRHAVLYGEAKAAKPDSKTERNHTKHRIDGGKE